MHEHSFLYGPVNRWLTTLFGPPPVSKLSASLARFFFPEGPDVWIPDHVIMALFLLALLAVILPLARRTYRKRSPGWFQSFNEMIILGIRGLVDDIVGHGAGYRFLPLFGTFAYFILFSNLMGFFFFLTPPTSSFQTTLALALTSFLFYNVQGIRAHGILGYLRHFCGPVLILAPLMFPIEIVGNLARIFSLSLRLAGNIGGEHIASGIFFGMVPIIVPWPMMLLGLIGAMLQTFIFLILSSIYLGGAVAHEEH
jgi:F-type H+-transporting ATPase subunit a